MQFEKINKMQYESPSENWYEEYVEKPIIPTVKFLRNNGINTTGSCAHGKWIVWIDFLDRKEYVRKLLKIFGYEKFRIIRYPCEYQRFDIYKIFIFEELI